MDRLLFQIHDRAESPFISKGADMDRHRIHHAFDLYRRSRRSFMGLDLESRNHRLLPRTGGNDGTITIHEHMSNQNLTSCTNQVACLLWRILLMKPLVTCRGRGHGHGHGHVRFCDSYDSDWLFGYWFIHSFIRLVSSRLTCPHHPTIKIHHLPKGSPWGAQMTPNITSTGLNTCAN